MFFVIVTIIPGHVAVILWAIINAANNILVSCIEILLMLIIKSPVEINKPLYQVTKMSCMSYHIN